VIRVYFVFNDPLDDAGVNLSYVDVPTGDPSRALARVEEAGVSGELWRHLYPDDEEHEYTLVNDKIAYLDISRLHGEATADTLLPI
jgi:hypothetical protein